MVERNRVCCGLSRDRPKFSVIVPTLQRSHRLDSLIRSIANHGDVGEVIVINNSSRSLRWESLENVRVLNQRENIYVNPAWNLGVSEATNTLVLICNDDISFSPSMLSLTRLVLTLPGVGIVGPSRSTYLRNSWRPIIFTPTYKRREGYGIWMAMRKQNYIPIPSDLLIWAGDDWLFYNQGARRNLRLHGGLIKTEMSTTVNSDNLRDTALKDFETYTTKYIDAEVSYLSGKRVEMALVGLFERLGRRVKRVFGLSLSK